MRKPPSRSSVFLPVKGHVSAKRSPPLSLVKITMVLSVDAIGMERLKDAADLAIQIFDHAPIGFVRAAVEVGERYGP